MISHPLVKMVRFCLLMLVFDSTMTFPFSSQRNADVLKPKLICSFRDFQVTGFESAHLQLQQQDHTLEKCWECQHRLLWSALNHRHMNIIHSSTKRFQDVTGVFKMLYEESDSLHRSWLSHIKDTFSSGSGFTVRRMDRGSWGFLPQLKSESDLNWPFDGISTL